MTTEPTRASFRIGFVPGVTLSKWSRLWEERRADLPLDVAEIDASSALDALHGDAAVDMLLARLPLATDDDHSVIRLYDERAVAVVSKDHPLAALGIEHELTAADLEGETRHDLDPTLTDAQAVDVAATGAGVAVVPQSIARLYSRSGLTYRFVSDLEPTVVALVWLVDRSDDDTDDFIGVVRGRTARSSRSRRRDEPEQAAPAKKGSTPDPRGAKPKRTPPQGRGPQRGTGRSRPRRSR